MKIVIYGAGYVGLVSAACFATWGHNVVLVDIDEAKIAALNEGEVPIYEPGLGGLIQKQVADKRLTFVTQLDSLPKEALYFICVGTPSATDGSADLRAVWQVIETLAYRLSSASVIVMKSTVPVGTGCAIERHIAKILQTRGIHGEVSVASNPEFLREGQAIDDFLKADRVILGVESKQARDQLLSVYQPLIELKCPMVIMDRRSAELSKYASNAMLASRLSFINEMANIADASGADMRHVVQGMGLDPRIGAHFLGFGCGYGGSCFPKDVSALKALAKQRDVPAPMLAATEQSNHTQKLILFKKLQRHFKGQLQDRRIALWGLAFKPHTDDMREAPSATLIDALLHAGCEVYAYDPAALTQAKHYYADHPNVVLCEDPYACLQDADALMLVTEWNIFKEADMQRVMGLLKSPVIFDGRCVYDPRKLAAMGFQYDGIGVGSLVSDENE